MGLDASLQTGASVLTAAQAPGGGGGGGSITLIESTDGSVGVTGGAGPTVNLSVPAQFGPDTIIKLPNNAAALVNALELIASLSSNVAGAERSQWLIKTLLAGAPISSLLIDNGIAVPNGSQASPAIRGLSWPQSGFYFAGLGTGFDGRPIAVHNNNACCSFGAEGIIVLSNAGAYYCGADAITFLQRFGPEGGLQLIPGPSDVAIGPNTALAAGAAHGFLDMCRINASAPTGVPNASHISGLSPTVQTNIGAWRASPLSTPLYKWSREARRGKGADVAAASTTVIAPADRTARDYFHLVGTTAVDLLAFDAVGDVYGPINDGEEVTFYVVNGLTIHQLGAAQTATAAPFALTGGADAVLAAGAKICFRLDLSFGEGGTGVWLEMWRTGP